MFLPYIVAVLLGWILVGHYVGRGVVVDFGPRGPMYSNARGTAKATVEIVGALFAIAAIAVDTWSEFEPLWDRAFNVSEYLFVVVASVGYIGVGGIVAVIMHCAVQSGMAAKIRRLEKLSKTKHNRFASTRRSRRW